MSETPIESTVSPNSILKTVKKMLGLDVEHTAFDEELVVHINAALMVLGQLGVGPSEGVMITGYDETWSDLIPPNVQLAAAQQAIYLRVRLAWDPPGNSFIVKSFEDMLKELDWRLQVMVETYTESAVTP